MVHKTQVAPQISLLRGSNKWFFLGVYGRSSARCQAFLCHQVHHFKSTFFLHGVVEFWRSGASFSLSVLWTCSLFPYLEQEACGGESRVPYGPERSPGFFVNLIARIIYVLTRFCGSLPAGGRRAWLPFPIYLCGTSPTSSEQVKKGLLWNILFLPPTSIKTCFS